MRNKKSILNASKTFTKDEIKNKPWIYITFTKKDYPQIKWLSNSTLESVSCIFDVSEWMNKHPGGKDLIEQYLGGDATKGFMSHKHDDWAFTDIMPSIFVGILNN